MSFVHAKSAIACQIVQFLSLAYMGTFVKKYLELFPFTIPTFWSSLHFGE